VPGKAALPEAQGAAARQAGGPARRRYDAGGGASAAITSLTGAGGGGRGGDRRVMVGMIESESLGVADATTGDVKPVYIQARPVGANEPRDGSVQRSSHVNCCAAALAPAIPLPAKWALDGGVG